MQSLRPSRFRATAFAAWSIPKTLPFHQRTFTTSPSLCAKKVKKITPNVLRITAHAHDAARNLHTAIGDIVDATKASVSPGVSAGQAIAKVFDEGLLPGKLKTQFLRVPENLDPNHPLLNRPTHIRTTLDRPTRRQYRNSWFAFLEGVAWRKFSSTHQVLDERHLFTRAFMLQQRDNLIYLRRHEAVREHVYTETYLRNQRTAEENAARSAREAAAKPHLPPSAASGGVPEPTAEYLENANKPHRGLNKPRRILVVLDLNGTLLYRPVRHRDPTKFFLRPHALLFLKYLLRNFVVMIWSSARTENVEGMVDKILEPDLRKQLFAVWGRDKFGLTEQDARSRVQVYKRLTKIWHDIDLQRGRDGSRYNWGPSNTVLIDDSAEKARSEPYNLVQIPEFVNSDGEMHILPQIHDYLNTLAVQEDISRYIRAKPFQQNYGFELTDI